MNIPKEKLFRIVKSMTPAEKRYFKVHYGSTTNALTILFNKLNAIEEYDENELRQALPDNISEHLKVFKIRLQERLLKSLTSYRYKKTILSKIRYGLEEVELLMSKQLNDMAEDHLAKIKKLAHKYEEFTYLIEISYLEIRLLSLSIDKQGISEHPIFQNLQENISKLDRQIELTRIGHQMLDHQKKYIFTPLEDNEIQWLNHFLSHKLDLQDSNTSFRAQLSANITNALIHRRLGNPEPEFEARKQNVELFNTFPHFKEKLTFEYLAVLRNYTNYCLENQRYNEVQQAISEAETFIHQKTPHEKPQLMYFYFSDLKILLDRGAYQTILEKYGYFIESFAVEYNLMKHRITFFNFIFILLAELINENYQRAYHFLHLAQGADTDVIKNNETLLFCLELMIHHSANDLHSLRNSVIKIKRKQRFAPHDHSILKVIIEWQKSLLKAETEPLLISQKTRDTIEEEYAQEPIYQIFQYFQVDKWWKGYAVNQSFRKYYMSSVLTPFQDRE